MGDNYPQEQDDHDAESLRVDREYESARNALVRDAAEAIEWFSEDDLESYALEMGTKV